MGFITMSNTKTDRPRPRPPRYVPRFAVAQTGLTSNILGVATAIRSEVHRVAEAKHGKSEPNR